MMISRRGRIHVAAAVSVAAMLVAAAPAPADTLQPPRPPSPPCTTATPECTGWVTIGGGPARSMIYRSQPLDARNDRVRRALIMVHGASRNADHYFATAMAAAFLAGALEDTVVIAPRIIACTDKPEANEVLWSCSGDSWRSGGASPSHPALSSFDLVDEILRSLARKQSFPNLRHIVLAGHSAGGQYVSRYEMANRVHDTLGVPVSYVVANPSSYAWPAATRAVIADDAEPVAAKDGWSSDAIHTKFSYGPTTRRRARTTTAGRSDSRTAPPVTPQK